MQHCFGLVEKLTVPDVPLMETVKQASVGKGR